MDFIFATIYQHLTSPNIETVGWIGSFLFAVCGLPQAIHSYKHKNSDGLSWGFLLMWGFGEIFSLIYVFQKTDVLPLIFNYTANLVFFMVILYYKLFPTYKTALPQDNKESQVTDKEDLPNLFLYNK